MGPKAWAPGMRRPVTGDRERIRGAGGAIVGILRLGISDLTYGDLDAGPGGFRVVH